jgi:hypothetical protein
MAEQALYSALGRARCPWNAHEVGVLVLYQERSQAWEHARAPQARARGFKLRDVLSQLQKPPLEVVRVAIRTCVERARLRIYEPRQSPKQRHLRLEADGK